MAVVENSRYAPLPGESPDDLSFDPYYKWLGIPSEEQPPNHYRLLGVQIFESDPDVISNAADARMAQLKTYSTGRFSGISQQLLNEVSGARVCLLNPQKKAGYDGQLRARTARRTVPAPPPVASSSAPSPLDFLQTRARMPEPQGPNGKKSSPSVLSWFRNRTKAAIAAIGGVAAVLVAGTALLTSDAKQEQTTDKRPSATKKLPATAPEIARGGAMASVTPVQDTTAEVREDVRKKMADPLKDCPIEIDLPPRADESGNFVVAKIRTSADTPWALTMEGSGADPHALQIEAKDQIRPPIWLVHARSAGTGKESQPIAIARFLRFDDELFFGWYPEASSVTADQLRACKLKIRVGSVARTIDLSTFKSRSELPIEPPKDESGDLSLLPVTLPIPPAPKPAPPPQEATNPPPVPAETPTGEKGNGTSAKPPSRSVPPHRLPGKKEVQKGMTSIDLLERFANMGEKEFAACITRGKVQRQQATGSAPARLELFGDQQNFSHIYLPQKIEGGYKYSVRFVRVAGSDSVEVDFPVGSSMTTLALSCMGGEAGGLARVDDLEPSDRRNPTRISPCRLMNGVEYQLDVEVSQVRRVEDEEWTTINVFLREGNGRPIGICRYVGRTAALTMQRRRVQEQQGFGIATWTDANRVRVNSAVVQSLQTNAKRRTR